MNKNEILENAIDKYGVVLQQVIASEELSELIKEITKQLRGIGKRDNLIEEIADVLICIDQLKIIHRITDEQIEDEIKFKLLRLVKTLGE